MSCIVPPAWYSRVYARSSMSNMIFLASLRPVEKRYPDFIPPWMLSRENSENTPSATVPVFWQNSRHSMRGNAGTSPGEKKNFSRGKTNGNAWGFPCWIWRCRLHSRIPYRKDAEEKKLSKSLKINHRIHSNGILGFIGLALIVKETDVGFVMPVFCPNDKIIRHLKFRGERHFP